LRGKEEGTERSAQGHKVKSPSNWVKINVYQNEQGITMYQMFICHWNYAE